MRRELRAVMVAALVAVFVIDPATACHYYGNWGYSGPCRSYCEPVSCCGGCCEYEVVDSGRCGCDGESVYDRPSSDSAPREQYQPGGERARPHSGPANVHRPVDRMPRPQLPARPTQPKEQPPQPSRVQPMPSKETPPTTPSADDLFGPPSKPAAEPTNDLFGPSKEPVTPPADAQPSTSRESSDAGPTFERYTPPAEQPSEPSSDNLFGPTDSEPAKPETTDEPLSEPSFDDFFSTPPAETATPAEEEKPKEEDQQPAPAEEDDLFNFGAVLREPGGFVSTDLRRWADNTGRYSCRGRLLRVLDGKVQLLKDNGRTTTVPFGRLCQNDLQFVHRQASAQRAETVGQTAQVVPQRLGQ